MAAFSYTFQIYFDFSGYSDMAIGISYLFGFKLPLNFNSPYKATSIIDFWRRWHMTLSRFLRDYLYVPLGGNRDGKLVTIVKDVRKIDSGDEPDFVLEDDDAIYVDDSKF